MDGLVSVIIPVYNHAYTLKRTFECLNNQTYTHIEVIVVNDGSTDAFESELGKITSRFPLHVRKQANQGAAAARNAGYALATGEFVLFWDADTIAKPTMITMLKHALDTHAEASYAYCQYRFGWKKMRSQTFSAADLKKYNYIDTTSLIRKSALSNCDKPFDEALRRFQDWDLWLTLAKQNKTGVCVPQVLFKKIVRGRIGYSSWLPSFVYRLPWLSNKVKKYTDAKEIIMKKHKIV